MITAGPPGTGPPGSTTPPAVSLQAFDRRHLARTLQWTNDPELARLLGRARPVTEEEHGRWFAGLAERTDTLYFGIETGDGRHVGNVWLADIDRRHEKAEVRIVIGDPAGLGRGFGSRAIDLAASHAFGVLHLHRVYAYVLGFNVRARKAFENAGFALEGVLRQDRRSGDGYTDVLVLGRIAPQS
jgi:RimJ/RimL family protein N-acetyltransferase